MFWRNMKDKYKRIICIATIGVLLTSTIVFAAIYLVERQEEAQRIQTEQHIRECYVKQNRAFCLGQWEWFIPYSQLRNYSGECSLYQNICYYNYMTGSDFALSDVLEFLAMPYEPDYGPSERKGELMLYEYYDGIREYVEFMDELYKMDRVIGTSKAQVFNDQFFDLFYETVDKNPALSKYKSVEAPLQLIDELVHKIVDPAYEMDLEITDERSYMYLTPVAYATGYRYSITKDDSISK